MTPELHDILADSCSETSAFRYASACESPEDLDFDAELIEDSISGARLEALMAGEKPTEEEQDLFAERSIEGQLYSDSGPHMFAFFKIAIHPRSELPGWVVPDDVEDSAAWEEEAAGNVKIFVGSNGAGNFIEPLDDFDGPFDSVEEAVASLEESGWLVQDVW